MDVVLIILCLLMAILTIMLFVCSLILFFNRDIVGEFIEWRRREKLYRYAEDMKDDELMMHIDLDIPARQYKEFESLINNKRMKGSIYGKTQVSR